MLEPPGKPVQTMAAAHQAADVSAPRFDAWRLLLMVLLWLALLVALVIFSGRAPVTGPAGMSLPRATFFVASAASLTGFDTTWAPPQSLTRIHAIVAVAAMLLTALLSTSIATAAFARVSGRALSWRQAWVTSAIFLVGLMIVSMITELIAGRSLWSSAWNGCVVVTAGGMLAGKGGHDSPVLWLARFPLAALAAIGPFVLLDSLRVWRSQSLSRFSQVSWIAIPVTFVSAIAVVCAAQALTHDDGSLANAAVVAIDARGAGFTDSAGQLSHAARWTLIPVLLLGGASGGVGGGLKAITALVLVVGVARLVRGGRAGRTFAIAAIWLASLAAVFAVTFVLLLQVSPQLRPDRAAILAAAACGNAGVSVDPVGATSADAYILAAAMLLGRALPWVLLWWSATRGDEPVAIG